MESNGDRPPLWPFLAVCAVLAACIDLGSFHRHHTADAVVPVLTSLYKWTPYYWECNRIGMLVPLLAIPFQSPLANLLVQSWLVLFAALAALFLLPRFLLRNAAWPLAGLLATAVFLILVPEESQASFTFGQPHYAVALALGLGALILIEDGWPAVSLWPRLAVAAVLLFLAQWVNSAAVVFLGPLLVGRQFLGAPLFGESPSARGIFAPRRLIRGETGRGLAALAAGCAGGFVLQRLIPAPEDPVATGFLSPLRWPGGWYRLACNTWTALLDGTWQLHDDNRTFLPPVVRPGSWPLLALSVAALALVLTPAARRRNPAAGRAALTLMGAAAVYGGVISSLRWVAACHFHCRYGIPIIFFFLAGLAIALAAPLAAVLTPRMRRTIPAAAVPVLLLASVTVWGRPSMSRVGADVADWPGLAGNPSGWIAQRTADVLAARCSHVAGRYWPVWMTVFQANLALHQRGSDRLVWGLAGRCLATWEEWGQMPPEDLRVALLTEGGGPDPEGEFYLKAFFPPMTVVEKRPTLWVLRPTAEVQLERGHSASDGCAVQAVWHGGFYGFDGTAEANNRWCRGQGKLTLVNPSDRPRAVTLEAYLAPAGPAPANLWIEGPQLYEHVVLDPESVKYRRKLSLPPGRHSLVFSCDGRRVRAPKDGRTWVFRVTQFRMAEE
jgi:hypothetical protein